MQPFDVEGRITLHVNEPRRRVSRKGL
jgi:hypothetical protein